MMQSIISTINNSIPQNFRKNAFIRKILMIVYYLSLKLDPEMLHRIDVAVKMCGAGSEEYNSLIHSMLNEFIITGTTFAEFAKFEFYSIPREERDKYIPDYEVLTRFKMNDENNILPPQKNDRFFMFKEFFKRNVLCMPADSDVSESKYESFVSGKEKIVVKTLTGCKGLGVKIVDAKEISNLSAFRERYGEGYLLEEVIIQGAEMKRFHPCSVNTVRFVTGIDFGGTFHYLFALVRFGRGESVVDNVGSGGLIAMVDLNSGEICTSACCGTERFEFHPDTGVSFRHFRIPNWEELKSQVREMHLKYPEQRIFGFDMAWTDKGWDLVEVNPAPSFSSYQELSGKGIRPYLREIGII